MQAVNDVLVGVYCCAGHSIGKTSNIGGINRMPRPRLLLDDEDSDDEGPTLLTSSASLDEQPVPGQLHPGPHLLFEQGPGVGGYM